MKKIILFLILSTTIIMAQPRWLDKNDPPPRDFGRRFIIEKLQLTVDQEKQFDKLQSDVQKKQIELRSKVQSLRIDVRDLMREETPSQSKIESKITEISKLQNEMKLNHLSFWFDVNKILTPDQQKIWKNHPLEFGFDGGKPDMFGKGPGHMGRHARGM